MSALSMLLSRYSRGHGSALLFYSLIANIAILAPSFHMLQVYDRVLNSGSLATLLYLTLMGLFVLAVYASAETARARLCQRLAASYSTIISPRLFARTAMLGDPSGSARYMRDFQMVRQFIGGKGLTSVFDLPFIPIYLLLLLMMHWSLAVLTLAGIGVMFAISIVSHRAAELEREKNKNAEAAAASFSQNAISHGDNVVALGLLPNFIDMWAARMNSALSSAEILARKSAGYASWAKSFRQMLQIASMALGAFLVLEGMMSAGMIVLASMVAGKALGPLDQFIAGREGIIKAAAAFRELEELTGEDKQLSARTPLPEPKGRLEVVELGFREGEGEKERILLSGVNLTVEPGQLMVVSGATGSGKTLLARCLVGATAPGEGQVLLDKAPHSQWPAKQWGEAFGYVAQMPELIPGPVAVNIARFEPQTDAKMIYDCAMRAGAHEMILKLPEGYSTIVGPGGFRLSEGQKQRIAMARALYGNPKVLVLDQPSAHLDPAGEGALVNCLIDAKKRGMAVIVFSAKRSIFRIAEKAMELKDGRLEELDLNEINRMGVAFRRAMTDAPSMETPQPTVAKDAGAIAS